MTGIYLITNTVNDKIYVGQTVDIEDRWGNHKARLNGGYHNNKHLQRSWNKYGSDSFSFTVLTECAEEQLNTMEEYFIFCLDSYDKRVGYNKNYGGGSGRPTEETKRKLSESQKNDKKKSKTVIGIHKVTGLIIEYPSTKEAARIIGICNGHISECCRGIRKSAGGYTWMYSEE